MVKTKQIVPQNTSHFLIYSHLKPCKRRTLFEYQAIVSRKPPPPFLSPNQRHLKRKQNTCAHSFLTVRPKLGDQLKALPYRDGGTYFYLN